MSGHHPWRELVARSVKRGDLAPLYLGEFAGPEDVAREFAVELPHGATILTAAYAHANDSGDAFVLFTLDARLWEVNACHCSCYGLEGQWRPEQVALRELLKRPEYLDAWSGGAEWNQMIRLALLALPHGLA